MKHGTRSSSATRSTTTAPTQHSIQRPPTTLNSSLQTRHQPSPHKTYVVPLTDSFDTVYSTARTPGAGSSAGSASRKTSTPLVSQLTVLLGHAIRTVHRRRNTSALYAGNVRGTGGGGSPRTRARARVHAVRAPGPRRNARKVLEVCARLRRSVGWRWLKTCAAGLAPGRGMEEETYLDENVHWCVDEGVQREAGARAFAWWRGGVLAFGCGGTLGSVVCLCARHGLFKLLISGCKHVFLRVMIRWLKGVALLSIWGGIDLCHDELFCRLTYVRDDQPFYTLGPVWYREQLSVRRLRM